MSQNSFRPNSPTNHSLKSRSCRAIYGMEFEENRPAENTLERLQREVEEELRHSDRLIISVNDLLAQDKGNIGRNYCSHPRRTEEVCFSLPSRPVTAPGRSRMSVIFSLPFCDEETPPELPSPPQSVIRCETRDVFPGTCQRVARLPPLDRTAIKPRITSPPLRSYPISDKGLREPGVIKKKEESSNYSNIGDNLSHSKNSTSKSCSFDAVRDERHSGRPLVETKNNNPLFDKTKSTGRPLDGARDTRRPLSESRDKGRPYDGTKDKYGPSNETRVTSRPLDSTRETSRPYDGTKDKGGPSNETKDISRPLNGKRDGTRDSSPSNENKCTTFAIGRGSCESGCKILYGTEDTSVPPAHEMSKPSPCAFSASNVPTSSGISDSRRDFRESPIRHFSRKSRPSSSDFASRSSEEIAFPELQPHARHNARSLSPPYCRTPQPPSGLTEDLKDTKIEVDPHFHHGHYYNESPQDFFDRDERVAAALNHLSQLRKTPSCYKCGVGQGTEFLNVCCSKVKDTVRAGSKVPKLPKAPCLPPEDINDLIKCETKDVESVWYLTSDEKKTHKKPCPKQQKAQLAVKNLVQAQATQKCGSAIYSPLEHPDPEDISPEVAASMMFSQEQGIRMEECPNSTIAHLFPDEPKPQFPEKFPQGSISVLDPRQNNQEEMIEKSAAVPSEGVSDSAYTRTMREKGEDIGPQKSFDVNFAIGQSKREYVFVAQKPQRVNKIQFRGNSSSWFPGYFSAFPEDEGLKVVSSPSGLFYKAWVQSNPGNIPANDVIVLE